MAKDDGEYEETKVRVYKRIHHKDESKMQKVGAMLKKTFTPGEKSGSKEKRLTA